MAPIPTHAAGTEAALTDAFLTLRTSKEAPGKKERAFDKLGNGIASANESPTLTFLNNFYHENSAVFSAAVAGLSSLDNKQVDSAITGFSESVKVVLNGLEVLGQVHPFVGVAVVAFKLVVTLDMTRRSNNQKVMAVKVQMQQMMCTLFQLRRVKDSAEVGPDGTILQDRMQPLMEQIARDIKECGSACDVYLKKSFIAKTLKSKIYEGRLADYVAKFMDYADQLDKALTVHIALGVDAANEKLDFQSTALSSIESKVDALYHLFRRLDTPREREVLEFIEEHGGSKAVIERNDLVERLVKKSGETISGMADKNLTSKSDIDSVKEKLKKELAEDVDSVMKRNFTLFDRKLAIQSRNIQDALDKQGQYIVSVLSSGMHDKIKDPDLQNLWREMGWKGSVKARHFVLALRDYFTDQFTSGTPLHLHFGAGDVNTLTVEAASPSPIITPIEPSSDFLIPHLPGLHDDKWALEFINVAHLQAILEAIDDDGTGFISIKEANTFAVERPRGWSLLHWIAFWAKGWEMSLASYENKIFLILKEMDTLLSSVLPANRYHVDTYLRHYSVTGIELTLRSVQTSNDYSGVCQELCSLSESYASREEERLRLNLESVGWDVDSANTVVLITGPGRIERFLFPLLYLTLKRHLEVFHYACRHAVESDEFSHMSATLGSIFDVVESRIESLGAIYKQVHVDLSSHLENFALGMFHHFAKNNYDLGARESLIITWKDTSRTKNEPSGTDPSSDTVLTPDVAAENANPIFGVTAEGEPEGDRYKGVWQGWPRYDSFFTVTAATTNSSDPPSDTSTTRITTPDVEGDICVGEIYGFWSGHFWSSQGDSLGCALGLTQLKIEVDEEGMEGIEGATKLKGYAVTYSGRLELFGRRRWVGAASADGGGGGEGTNAESGSGGYENIDIVMTFDDGYSVRLVGRMVKDHEKLVGAWATFPEKEDAKKAYDDYPFGEDPSSVSEEEEAGSGSQCGKSGEGSQGEEGEQTGDGMVEEAKSGENEEEEKETGQGSVEEETDIPVEHAVDVNEGDAAAEGETKSTKDENDDEAPIIRTFIFHRTPAEVYRFRDLLFEDEDKVKARWKFLRESVLFLVRRHLWSWKNIKGWGEDRHKFLDFYKRNWLLAMCNFMTPNPLTPEDKSAWYLFKYTLPPANIRLCVEALSWSLNRLPFHYGISCDGCHYRLIEPRFICLTCMDGEMSNSFDLCSQCIDKPAERDDFTHSPDHTLIKCRQYIHKYFFAWLINEARLMTTRLKKTFSEIMEKEVEGAHGGEDHHVSNGGHSELLCGCCAKPVRVPCWICITCARETYVCNDCEEKELPVLKDGSGSPLHHPDHSLLRIHNLDPARFESEKLDPTVARINALETTVNQKFELLESTVESRTSALESKIEARLSSFEDLLRRIAIQLDVLEPVSEAPGKGEDHATVSIKDSEELAHES